MGVGAGPEPGRLWGVEVEEVLNCGSADAAAVRGQAW